MNYNKNGPANEYHGLLNQGATCYLNSVLQVLFMTEDFREAVERNTSGNPDPKVIDGPLRNLFEDLKGHQAYTYNITRKLDIDRVYEQRDAAECFENILNITSPEASAIFHGLLTRKTICSTCGAETDTDGAFWHLPLELVDSNSHNYSVVDGIEEHFRDTYFSGENQIYCERCDDKSDATIKCVMKHHPEVLMLLLKRFQFDYNYMTNVKNSRAVVVPYKLQIPKNQTYELYGIVDHSGGLRGGHYTATIKSQEDEKWYKFDDSSVALSYYQPFQLGEFETSNSAYLLFYRKKNVHAADTCTQDNREVSSPEVLPPATSVINDQCEDNVKMDGQRPKEEMATPREKNVDDLNNFTGRLDDSRHMSSQGHINTSYYDQKFKQEDSSTHAGCDNPQQAQKDEKITLLEVDKDKDVMMQGDKKSEIIEKAPTDNLRDRYVDVGFVPSVVDKQGGEERNEGDKDGKTGAHEKGMALRNEKLLTIYDLSKGRVGDSKQNLSQDDQRCEQRSSSRYEKTEQQREEKSVQRDKEQKRRDKHEKRERRETSMTNPQPKSVNLGQMKTNKVIHEDVSVDRRGGGEKMKDVKADKDGERGMARKERVDDGKHMIGDRGDQTRDCDAIHRDVSETKQENREDSFTGRAGQIKVNHRVDSVNKTRQPKARAGSYEDTVEGRQGLKQTKTYQVKVIEEDIETSSGITISSKTKNIGKVITEGSSRHDTKRVEYNEGNDPTADDEITLSESVGSLKLSDSSLPKSKTWMSKILKGSKINSTHGKKRKMVSCFPPAEEDSKENRKRKTTTGCSLFQKRRKNADEISESD